jgi:hypothetical protein
VGGQSEREHCVNPRSTREDRGFADPRWMTDPQRDPQLAGALCNSAARSFDSDPAKFIGNAFGTIGARSFREGTPPGLLTSRVTELATDASKAARSPGTTGRPAVFEAPNREIWGRLTSMELRFR